MCSAGFISNLQPARRSASSASCCILLCTASSAVELRWTKQSRSSVLYACRCQKMGQILQAAGVNLTPAAVAIYVNFISSLIVCLSLMSLHGCVGLRCSWAKDLQLELMAHNQRLSADVHALMTWYAQVQTVDKLTHNVRQDAHGCHAVCKFCCSVLLTHICGHQLPDKRLCITVHRAEKCFSVRDLTSSALAVCVLPPKDMVITGSLLLSRSSKGTNGSPSGLP